MSWWIFGKKEEEKTEDKILENSIANQNISIEDIENIPKNQETPAIRESPSTNHNFVVARKSDPFFVRIDRFQDAKENLSEIGKKLKEMETILGKINEVKIKEDEEISSWKEEIKTIRSHLSNIDQSLFNNAQF